MRISQRLALSCAVFFMLAAAPCSKGADKDSKLEADDCGTVVNLHRFGDRYFLAGQPGPEDFKLLKERGLRSVINLRTAGEVKDFDEEKIVKDLGLEYHHLPVGKPADMTNELFAKARRLLAQKQGAILLHCASANRVGAIWLVKRTLDDKVPYDEALQEARKVGLRSAGLEERATQYIREQGVDVSRD